MENEGAHTEGYSNEREHQVGFSKETLTQFLENHRVIDGAGKSGIVFRVTYDELSEADKEIMSREDADNPEGSLSIKALKIFNVDSARREFRALQEARQLVLEHAETSSAPVARIPRGIKIEEVEVDKKTQDFLNDNGASIIDGKVGIIIMDWIEGKDLGAILREELLKITPEGQDAYEDKLWDDPNCDELIHVLEKRGFVLPPAIITQIKNTLDLIHKNNFSHGDAHPGNLILKDGDLQNPRVYIIDWADAYHGTKTIEDAPGEYFLSDEKIVKNLSRLTKTPEEKERSRKEAGERDWNERIALLEQQPKAQGQYRSLKKSLEEMTSDALDKNLIIASSTERDLENFLGNLLRLAREDVRYRDQIANFLNGHISDKKSKLRSFVVNRMQSLEKAIEI